MMGWTQVTVTTFQKVPVRASSFFVCLKKEKFYNSSKTTWEKRVYP